MVKEVSIRLVEILSSVIVIGPETEVVTACALSGRRAVVRLVGAQDREGVGIGASPVTSGNEPVRWV